MSQVKKFQNPSGAINKDLLNEALELELSSYNLRGKDERRVREALVSLRDLPEGTSFSSDQLAKTYSVTGPNAEKYKGSPDDIKSN
jgi:hypothetical protein